MPARVHRVHTTDYAPQHDISRWWSVRPVVGRHSGTLDKRMFDNCSDTFKAHTALANGLFVILLEHRAQ
jgi:gamma-glutamyl:cysteine ligase YbdK (ATP-grasp superfamily)